MEGIFDIHTHILPNIDDGPRSMDLTIEILKKEYEDGVRTIFATSHFRRGMFEPDLDRLYRRYQEVREKAQEVAGDLEILLGCEFHANMEMVETLKNRERPTMGGTRCVLTEFKNNSEKSFIKERCYALLSHGYQPIIAHAERYEAIRKNMDFLYDLVKMGNYVQLNSQSIIGDDGFFIKQFCKKAMQNNLVHFVGSDVHDMGKREPTMGRCTVYLNKLMGEDYTRKLLIRNPQKLILEDR